jgi:hypothetical protein
MQLKQSTAQREAAEKSRDTVQARLEHYQGLAFMNPWETAATTLSALAITQDIAAGIADALGAIAALVPQFQLGTSGFYSSPVVVTTEGGEQISRAATATASAARTTGQVFSALAAGSQTLGGYQRRQEDWNLQTTLASNELAQVNKQIVAAQIQEQIAQADLVNHDMQIENAKATEEFLKSKYTNQELYGWMQGQLAGLYFQAYKLAFDAAKKTERAFCYELGVSDSSYIQFGYWDSLNKGLMAGERLQSDLRRMEAGYFDQNVRELEIVKHISLGALNPAALIVLKTTGRCDVDIPEWLFDMDYPGHFMRRIKSLAVSIPCVVGPYASVNCTVTQLFSRVRLADSDLNDYGNAANFHEQFGSAQAIVTSSAREDSGLFEVNLRDERYLPFEGTGAISRWRIELPLGTNQFDLRTVSDVIFHLRYTARNGGEELRDAASDQVPTEGIRMISIRQEFPSAWYQMTTDADGTGTAVSELTIGRNLFPLAGVNEGKDLSVEGGAIYAVPTEDAQDQPFPQSLTINLPNRTVVTLKDNVSIGRLTGKTFAATVPVSSKEEDGKWKLSVSDPMAFRQQVDDILMFCRYREVPKPL